jgi:transposase-like protein
VLKEEIPSSSFLHLEVLVKTVQSLIDLIDQEACQCYIRSLRWKSRPLECPYCHSQDIAPWGKYHRKPGLLRYKCKAEGRTFNDLSGTLLDGSRLSCGTWVLLAFLLTLTTSCLRIALELTIAFPTAYRICGWLRNLALKKEKGRKLYGDVEADEIYQAAGSKGQQPDRGGKKDLGRDPRHRGLKKGPGRGHADKDTPCIIAWVSRKGKAVLNVVKDFTKATVQQAAQKALRKGCRVFTDSAKSYRVLNSLGFLHESVNHSQGEWVRGEVHENRAEMIWSLLKFYLLTFRGVSKALLPGYVGFFQFLFNHRSQTAFQKAELLLRAALDPAQVQVARQGLFAPVKTKPEKPKPPLHAA